MATPAERVRALLGERIPEGGSDGDTMFTNQEIEALLEGRTVEEAVAEGWKQKAAEFASLVDTAEGTSKRSMSDLHANALRMAEVYGGSDIVTPEARGRTRIHRLGRR